MSFKFDFEVEDAETNETMDESSNAPAHTVAGENTEAAFCAPAQEISVDWEQQLRVYKTGFTADGQPPLKTETIVVHDGECLTCVSSTSVEQELKQAVDESPISRALATDSDLLPHVYEGGLKIWECSRDLLDFISQLPVPFSGRKVLELGCGAGLPGIYAQIKGAEVHYQDYNEDVIRRITIPNVSLNVRDRRRCRDFSRFFSGDWDLVRSLLLSNVVQSELDTEKRYDVILTSETIYSRESYQKLHDVMVAVLKPTGVIYLAAKTYYFGVGGGVREFEAYIESRAIFNSKIVHTLQHEGVQREILQLTLKLKS